MTTSTRTLPTPEPSDDSGPDRSLIALIAAGILVVVGVALVLVFGIARPPALTSLADEPFAALDAGVAWSNWNDEGLCLFVARPDGSSERIACDRDGGEVIAWDDDGVVQRTWDGRDEVVWYDPATGDEVRREAVGADQDLGPHGDGDISSRRQDGDLVVRRGDADAVLWSTSAPDNYRINHGAISPDGTWAALFDSAGRLLVVPADGSDDPRVWAEDTSGWEVPVWEGTPLDNDASEE